MGRRAILVAITALSLILPGTSAAQVPDEVEGATVGDEPAVYLPLVGKNYIGESLIADIIFHNGIVLTMEKGVPQAQAVAIRGNMILAVGRDVEVLAQCALRTQVIDLDGLTLMPGFVDAHTHIFNSAGQLGLDLEGAQQLAVENGITTLANMYCMPEFLTEMRDFEASGRLHVRTSLYLNLTTNCGQVLGDWYKQHPPTRVPGEMLRIGGVKLFTDGGSCGGPAVSYDHPVFGYGDLWFTQQELNAMIADIHASGYQAAIHALGDRAIEQSLNAIEFALDGGPNTPRHRIEHNAVVRPDMLSRYGEIGVVPLIFGAYAICTSGFNPPPEPYQSWEWPWRDLLDANPDVHFAWHSDRGAGRIQQLWPVAPLLHLYSMVSPYEAEEGGTTCPTPAWLAQKTITVEEALPMMTIEGAYALFRDDEVGSLKAGKFADLIVLSENPLTVEPEAIYGIQVLMTMVDGRGVYSAPGHENLCPGDVWSDEFSAETLDGRWSWVREDPTHWSLTDRGDFLRITSQQGGLLFAANNARNLLLQDIPTGDFDIETRVLFTPSENFQMAGLLLYQDDDNFLMLGRAYCGVPMPVCVGNGIYFNVEERGVSVGPGMPMSTVSTGEAYLLVARRGDVYTCYVYEDGQEWTLVGQHTASASFRPTKIGLTTCDGDQGATEIPADFDYFLVRLLGE